MVGRWNFLLKTDPFFGGRVHVLGGNFLFTPWAWDLLWKKYLESKFEKNIFSLMVAGWWFRPIWNILVKLDHFPKNIFQTTTQVVWCYFTPMLLSLDIQNPPVIPGEDRCLEPKQDLLRRCLGVQNGFILQFSPGWGGCLGLNLLKKNISP